MKAGAGLFREVTGMVVPRCEFQINARNFHFLGGIFDPQVGETHLAMDDREVQVASESFLEPLGLTVTLGVSTAKFLIELFLQLVIQLDTEDLAAFAFDFIGGLVIQAVKISVVVRFLGLH